MTAQTAEPPADLRALLTRAQEAAARATTDSEIRAAIAEVRSLARRIRGSRWESYPWQHPHVHPEGWVSESNGKPDPHGACDVRCLLLPSVQIPAQGTWYELGGRGTGKTEGASRYVNAHAEGPACDHRLPGGHRIVIVAPTLGDAVEACVTGPSGLQTVNPDVALRSTTGGTVLRWPNGARARLLGAHGPDDVERLRAAGNSCLVWIEEAAAQRRLKDVQHHTSLGLRIGTRPHYVISTTPKNRPEVRAIRERANVVVTRGRTADAHRLDPEVRKVWEAEFAGTTLGRQELDGEELHDVEGALWVTDRPDTVDGEPNADERPGIENTRIAQEKVAWISHHPDREPPAPGLLVMDRTIVAVDPPGGRTEAGIIVVGFKGAHVYPLADLSIAGPPDTWARRAIAAYYDYGAVGIAAEHAYGGDMVTDVIGTRDAQIPIFRVPTKVGKRLRAEPVVALWQQGRGHMVGVLPGVEGEMTGWVEGEGESPNRLDALVHGVTWGMVRTKAATISSPANLARGAARPTVSAAPAPTTGWR